MKFADDTKLRAVSEYQCRKKKVTLGTVVTKQDEIQ